MHRSRLGPAGDSEAGEPLDNSFKKQQTLLLKIPASWPISSADEATTTQGGQTPITDSPREEPAQTAKV